MKSDPKYPRTGRLLRAAQEEGGYTYEDIAEKAGLKKTSKSQVSGWVKGKSKATSRQMQYFINKYESLINRGDKHLFRIRQDAENISYLTIKGELVLNHTSYEFFVSGKSLKRVAVKRVRIIKDGERLWLIGQDRAELKYNAHSPTPHQKYASGENENSIWVTREPKEVSISMLLQWADEGVANFYGEPSDRNTFASDLITLPFNIRELLIKLGYSPEGVASMINQNPMG